MSPTRGRHRTLLSLALVIACSRSQAYQIGSDPPLGYRPSGEEIVEVVEELPPFTFEPDVIEIHRAPPVRAASFTALPRMVLSNRCINAGAVKEGSSRTATKSSGTRWRTEKKKSKAKAKKKAPSPSTAAPAADTEAPEAEAAPSPPPEATGHSAGAGDASFADDDASARSFDEEVMEAPGADPTDSPAIVTGKRSRKKLTRNRRKADRRADREQRKYERAHRKDNPAYAQSSSPEPAYEAPPQHVVYIPAEMPPADEGWGQPLYVSNDDSMSLSSAQRIAFAVENFEALAPADIRPHELLNWAFGSLPGATDASHDFAVEGDILSREENGTHTMALAVHGRRVGRGGRRNAALTLVVDQSGSMKREGRMDFVRRGLLRMVRELKKGDIINLVTFDNRVCPRLTNFVVGRDEPQILHREILRIKPRGATNLHAGLKQGYALADAGYQPAYTNRVMVITDALANRGVTDSNTLSMVADFYDSRRIRLSGIGVGKEFNDQLLDRLTEKGRGAYVFLGSEEVVDRIFGDRFVSMVETIANDVHFRLHLPPTMRVEKFHGEESSTNREEVQAVHFFADTSQVLLVDVEAWQGQLRGEDDVMLEIEYQSPETGEVRIEQHVVHLRDAIDSGRGYAANGKLVLAFADGLATLARRPPPRGFQARPGGWPDSQAIAECADVRSELTAIADAPWQRSAVDVWDRFCSRYDQGLTRRPPRKR